MHPTPGQYRNYHFPSLLSAEDDVYGNESGSYQDEFQRGFDDGYQKGFDQGYQEGMNQGVETGRQEGLQQGIQQGMEQVKEQMHSSVTAVDQLMKQTETLFHQYVRDQSEMICDLVEKVACQVIRTELTLQPSHMIRLINEALAEIPEQQKNVTVYLNPQDCQRLIELMPDAVASWMLKQDESLATGSCRVVSDDAEAIADIDERLEVCMDSVRESVMGDA